MTDVAEIQSITLNGILSVPNSDKQHPLMIVIECLTIEKLPPKRDYTYPSLLKFDSSAVVHPARRRSRVLWLPLGHPILRLSRLLRVDASLPGRTGESSTLMNELGDVDEAVALNVTTRKLNGGVKMHKYL